MPETRHFITPNEEKRIVEAIGLAEKNNSGEIRVHIESHCPEANILDHAANTFAELGMYETRHHNAVLIYIAFKDRRFAVIGDSGMHAIVGDEFWEEVKEKMREEFKKGKMAEGIIHGVERAGEILQAHFPRGPEDTDELPNDISYGV